MSGPSARAKKRRRWPRLLAALVGLAVVAYLQASPRQKKYTEAAAAFLGDAIYCGLGFCRPEGPGGMAITEASDDTGAAPLVAIDIDGRGRLFAAQSGRINAGVLDNRGFTEAELDEELALASVADRSAMIERWIASGRVEADEFAAEADTIAIFSDEDDDGRLETRTELARFSDREAGIGAGILVRGEDVYYANIPDLWLLHDRDGDGRAEDRRALSHGWGVRWTFAGHDLHGLVQGPDGKIYFSVGDRGFDVTTDDGRRLRPDIDPGRGAVLRMDPDGSNLEIFAQGLRNPQEVAFDDFGNLFTVDNNSDSIDQARIVHVVDGGDSGWTMPFQLLRDAEYERGPWNAEKLWHPRHENQPAWIIPPLRFLGRGPAGLAYAPGLGLPEKWQGHFLSADYAYRLSASGIRAFEVKPDGAGFTADEPKWFLRNVLATDLAFAPDGSTWVSWYKQIPPQRGGFYRLRLDDAPWAEQSGRIERMQAILGEGTTGLPAGELASLLGFDDRRVRLAAQFELARRRDVTTLDRVARDRAAPLLARLHALWGLGQIGDTALLEAGWSNLDWTLDDSAEVRAHAARVVATAGDARLADALVSLLDDPNLRVRFFAANALGRLQHRRAVPALIEVLRNNDDRDLHLRHAAALALARMDDPETLLRYADDPSSAVRLGVLLAMRRTREPRIARFLADPQPALVVEAARAIHDLPIVEAREELAALGGRALPYRDEDPQTSLALHRRVLNANLRLGTPQAALRIAAHAASPDTPSTMRREALVALARFTRPPPRDAVLGLWMPHDERDETSVHAAIDTYVPRLLGGPFEGAAIEVAAAYGRVPLDDEALLARIAKEEAGSRIRRASLRALDERSPSGRAGSWQRAVDQALESDDERLRADARDILARRDSARAFASVTAIPEDAPTRERQRAIATLASLETPAADASLLDLLDRLSRGVLPPALQLDALEAARRRDVPALRAVLADYEAGLDPADPLASYQITLDGGDSDRGAAVFNGNGDCKRCHAVAGEGSEVGPDLDGIGARLGPAEILEAVVLPNATIAAGFESQGEESAMPAIGAELPPAELRDLIAYLASLR